MNTIKDLWNDKKTISYLLFFPAYLAGYLLIERANTGAVYHLVHTAVDDMIPFNEFFIIPYLAWHVLIVFIVFKMLINDRECYYKLMRFLIYGSLICLCIFLIYPTYQDLRPETFQRSNIFTWGVSLIYMLDTPTNVSPSMHVAACLGLVFAIYDTKYPVRSAQKWALNVLVIAICASTMLLKQHSVIDVFIAVPVGIIAGGLSFGLPELPVKVKYNKHERIKTSSN